MCLWERLFGGDDLFSAVEDGRLERVKGFLRVDGRMLERRDHLGRTPLLVAAFAGRAGVVAHLLALGADVRVRDGHDATALHWAAALGHREVVEALLGAGAELDARDAKAQTPLRLAVLQGHADVATLLRSRGASD